MGILKERLSEAIETKKNDSSTFIWKGPRVEVKGKYVQEEYRLMDCSEKQLQRNYDYCKTMLYNEDKKNPGRYVLLKLIQEQIQKCNCEMFLRWINDVEHKDKFTFVAELKRVLCDHHSENIDLKTLPISSMVSGIPSEFSDIPISLILDGGVGKLGYFDAKHITRTFIYKQGIWLTSSEIKDLTIKDDEGQVRNRLDVIKENLALRSDAKLYITPKGLTYSQLRAMITLRSMKYSDLGIQQLTILRNRILFSLIDDCLRHIQEWETRMQQIEQVATEKLCLLVL